MPNKKYNFLIPFNLSWNRSADYQRQTCLELAKKYKVIAYMEKDRKFILKNIFSFKKSLYPNIHNIYFFVPKDLIPFKRFKRIKELNNLINFKIIQKFYLDRNKRFFWIFDPIFYPLIKYIKSKTIYDCVDLVFNNNQKTQDLLKGYENKLIKKADYFFVNSNALRKKHNEVRTPNLILPQGFCIEVYKKPKNSRIKFPKGGKIIGFVGSVDQRIDFNLIKKLVKRNPKLLFVFWGPIEDTFKSDLVKTKRDINKLISFQNFVYGKSEDRNEVPTIVRQFDIGIIPYKVSQERNRYCYPMKLFEYFFEGKPVVSSPILELKRFPRFVGIANSYKDWEEKIYFFINKPMGKIDIKLQKQLALENTWSKKINAITKEINI